MSFRKTIMNLIIGGSVGLFFLNSLLYSQQGESKEKRKEFEKIVNSSSVVEEKLEDFIKDEDPLIRERAIIEVGKKKTVKAKEILIKGIKSDDYITRIASLEGIKNFTDENDVIDSVISALNDKNRNVRWKAVEVLGYIKSDKSVKAISDLLKTEKDSYIRRTAVEVLGKINTPRAIEELNKLKKTKDRELSFMATNVLNFILQERGKSKR